MHPSTRSPQSPTQLQVEAELDSPVPYNPPAAILDAVNVTADSAAKQSPTLDGAQFSQFFAILKHKVPDIVHSLLLPGMLFTFSETWLSLIRRVRQPFSNPTVPIPSRSTPVDQNFTVAQSLISILVEIPSRCDRARYAGIGTLCGAMVVFTLVLQVVVRLLMVYIVIVCLATIYILSIVEDLAQSLLHSGFPYAWSDDDDELVANVLALPKPFPMLYVLFALVSWKRNIAQR
ncbi:hypothetical protein BC629DRAFT_1504510 [Irpex lacteus]|nr:hypothetical protein BC629DRAFT_1504510 [Irpex lacteus]